MRIIPCVLAIVCLQSLSASTPGEFRPSKLYHNGPWHPAMPFAIDSVDIQGHKAKPTTAARLFHGIIPAGTELTDPQMIASQGIHALSFDINSTGRAAVTLHATGLPANVTWMADGKALHDSTAVLSQGTHRLSALFDAPQSSTSVPSIYLTSDNASLLSAVTPGRRKLTLDDILHLQRITDMSLSPDGSLGLVGVTRTDNTGRVSRRAEIRDMSDGHVIATRTDSPRWMPRSNLLYVTRTGSHGREIVSIDPRTGAETVMADGLPDGRFTMMPGEDALIYNVTAHGHSEGDVYEIINPEDRQPGWRDRNSLALYDLRDHTMVPVTFGWHDTRLHDISDDGRRILAGYTEVDFSGRPTTRFTILSIDLATMQADTVVSRDGFVGGAVYSPDGNRVLVSGSAEAFDGVGLNLRDTTLTPSMTENELFVVNLSDGSVQSLTADFDPSIKDYVWSRADGCIWITAENGELMTLHRINPDNGNITDIATPEDLVRGIALPRHGRHLLWSGQGATNPDRLYRLDTRTLRNTLVDDPNASTMAQFDLAECRQFNTVNAAGDTVIGRYYLPADFDPSRKYPLIVNYYGGCSPSSRLFDSRYPHQVYAAHDYVVFVVNPSGATGRGQDWAARHVNTAGKGVAEDIISATKALCREMEFIDSTRIGCIGASYGGFMTQYLQTQTPMFAAAISHAGISDHTSYWGEGYWGYSYSETAMANSYPWTRKDLYVDQSPLYLADRITTPLLFLHGDADTNVPPGESIQMFTALKLLGVPTAFVAVKDANHQITDYSKRRKWQETIFAWFARWLKDDPSWWEAMYPSENL